MSFQGLEEKIEKLKSELSTLQSKYDTEQSDWQARCATLESQIEALNQEHEVQVMSKLSFNTLNSGLQQYFGCIVM